MFTSAGNHNFEAAIKMLIPTALSGVSSPYYNAATYCLKENLFNEAIELLEKIPPAHHQFKKAIALKDRIYKKIIAGLQSEVLRLKMHLTELNLQLPTLVSESLRDDHSHFNNIIEQLINGNSYKAAPIINAPLIFSCDGPGPKQERPMHNNKNNKNKLKTH